MIKHSEVMKASLDNVYSEIIELSRSLGECKSSIESLEDIMVKSHGDLKNSIIELNKKLFQLEKYEDIRQRRNKMLWGILTISPSAIIKWLIFIACLSYVIFDITSTGIDQKFYNIIKFLAK
jgi:hypothetical protein